MTIEKGTMRYKLLKKAGVALRAGNIELFKKYYEESRKYKDGEETPNDTEE